MEKEIIDIIKSLIGGNLAFIGLIFTSLGIILSIKDNWKTKALRKSKEFHDFLSLNVWCVILTILLFCACLFDSYFSKISYCILDFVCCAYAIYADFILLYN